MLKAISVVNESKKGIEEPYQDSVMAPLDQEDERHIDKKEDDREDDNWEVEDEEALSRACEGDTTPITLIPISGEILGNGNHNNRDTLQYKSTG